MAIKEDFAHPTLTGTSPLGKQSRILFPVFHPTTTPMKAFEELVEEVYQDGDLRLEFVKYVQLRRKRREGIRQLKAQTPAPDPGKARFLSYDEISQTQASLSPETVALQRGMMFLSSSLFRTLSLRYALAAEAVHQLREAVVIRYEKTL